MKLYRLLTGQDDAVFCHRVTDALNKGWSLNGSPSMTFNTQTGQVMCAQAIVKDVEGKDYHPDMKLSEQ
ncbi:hypothetical protein ASE04_01570 [Rhizobium sp. Root708]|uniref:DUF1737 domain-containing protein n=1 Tax=Rhizobium sp. Root708 TaxID=1736592 RepID=UPI0007018D6C|nr:DUF1737 domain-containing protein [Rhizobium sp. Root708]KRB62892.1 hypothetical protein ASE04_01570 [Rhizobium sp. Root708]